MDEQTIHRVPKNQAPKTLDGSNFVKS